MSGALPDDDECIHGLGPIAGCVICNGREAREKAERDAIAYEFVAKFVGHCGKCGQPTDAGERIGATNDGRYIGECCLPTTGKHIETKSNEQKA